MLCRRLVWRTVTGIEGRRFDEQVFRLIRHGCQGTALDPGQGHGFLGVCDDQLGTIELDLHGIFPDGEEPFAGLGHANDDPPACELVEVEDVGRLPQFEEHEIGRVDDVVTWDVAPGDQSRGDVGR